MNENLIISIPELYNKTIELNQVVICASMLVFRIAGKSESGEASPKF